MIVIELEDNTEKCTMLQPIQIDLKSTEKNFENYSKAFISVSASLTPKRLSLVHSLGSLSLQFLSFTIMAHQVNVRKSSKSTAHPFHFSKHNL